MAAEPPQMNMTVEQQQQMLEHAMALEFQYNEMQRQRGMSELMPLHQVLRKKHHQSGFWCPIRMP